MAPIWKFLALGTALLAPAVLAQGEGEDDPMYRELCDTGLNTGERTKCKNCWKYLEDKDAIDACAILFSDLDTLDCFSEINDELNDQNQNLLDMSKVDSDNPFDWNKEKGKWSASFIIGTTAIPSRDSVFGAWRAGIADIIYYNEYENDIPRRWNFMVRKSDGDKTVDTIEQGMSCSPIK